MTPSVIRIIDNRHPLVILGLQINLGNALHSQLFRSGNDDDTATNDATKTAYDHATTRAVSNEWLERIASLYDEPHRAYHNANHVEDVLASLDVLSGSKTRRPRTSPSERADADEAAAATLTLAAFFHDAVYDPKSSSNEEDSAVLFLDFATDLATGIARAVDANGGGGVIDVDDEDGRGDPSVETRTAIVRSHEMVARVEEFVVATATHVSSAKRAAASDGGSLLAAFLDADMSVLGRDERGYRKYAASIREEYEFVPRDTYCEKRAEILELFLPVEDSGEAQGRADDTDAIISESSRGEGKTHEFIYATERGRELWEDRARQNLRGEIDMLRQGAIPGEK